MQPDDPSQAAQEAPSGAGQPAFLTVAELADYLRVSAHSVRHWRKRGYLPPAYLLGTRVVWRRGEIDTWLKGKREKTCFGRPSKVPSPRCKPHVRRGS